MRTRATRISWLLPWAEVSFSDVCEVVLRIAQPLLAHAERNKGCYSSLSQNHHCAKSRDHNLGSLHQDCGFCCLDFVQGQQFITFVKYLREAAAAAPRGNSAMRKTGPTTRGSPEKLPHTRQQSTESEADAFQRVGLCELSSLSLHTRQFAMELETATSAGEHRHFNRKNYLTHVD